MGKWDPYKLGIRDFFTATYSLFEMLALEEKTQVHEHRSYLCIFI
jgi:hypothetical protein